MSTIHKILFVVISIVIIPLPLQAQRMAIEFDRITVEDGLSQSTIYCILQDSKGFMWFGTEDGLNRYDGYSFKVFNHDPNIRGSLSNNRVISMIEDKDGRLWFATIGGGLCRFDYSTETFVSYKHNPDDPNSISIDRIMCIAEDSKGRLWIGTAEGGLNCYDPLNGSFKHYINSENNRSVLPSNIIRSLYFDRSGQLYIGTNSGIAKYDPKQDTFSPFIVRTENGNEYPLRVVRRFLEDNHGNLWIATDEDGLILYNPKNETFRIFLKNQKGGLASNTIHDLYLDDEGILWIGTFGGLQRYSIESNTFYTYEYNMADPRSISSNLIRSIYEDRTGVLWIGTYNNGINKFNLRNKKFIVYRNEPGNPFSLPSTTIRAIAEDKEGNIWIGSFGEGLIKLNPQTESFINYKHNPQDNNSISNNYITAIAIDYDGIIWLATNDGLCYFNQKTNRFKTFKHNPKVKGSLPDSRIRNIYIDSKNVIWVATLNNGFCRYNVSDGTFTHFSQNLSEPALSVSQDRITTFFEDNRGNFWIGTSDEGLNLFDRSTGKFKHYKNTPNDNKSLSINRIMSIFQDSSERLWVGTGGGGLNLFSYEDESFTAFRKADGLPNDVVFGILEDNNGYLWLSTNHGISRFNPNAVDGNKFRNFDKSDGLQNNEFSEGAFMKSRSGLLFFGGINNFNVFDPSKINDNPNPPLVYITHVSIFNRNAKPGEKTEEQINLLEEESISLDYWQNNISIHFTGLHYVAPSKNRYKYILEGFENIWVSPREGLRFATYTNLKPGEYTFRVIACNPDGVWNETGDSLKITIRSPFWNKWWFYMLVGLVFAGMVYVYVLYREASLRQKKEELEEMVALRTKEISERNIEIQLQAERLKQANEEIIATSEALAEQNKELQDKNDEISLQRNELENQRNSLANLAWELQDKNEEITNQRNEIEKQKDLLSLQKKEITDSIMYAKRIQQAVLPLQEQIKELFPEFFIFYRPKSIVSGDFYWATRIDDFRVIAAVDCTGHGVPGGFMSMLGVLMLNEIVVHRKILDPAQVLNQLRQNTISVLHQRGELGDTGDGMDISLCIIDDKNRILKYSGANNQVIVIQDDVDGKVNFIDLKPDRMPISYHLVMKSFTTHQIELTDNSTIFMFSDGLIDQFGGDHNKKFQLSRLKSFVSEHINLPLESQGIALEQFFDSWKGDNYQVDDVLVMGLKV